MSSAEFSFFETDKPEATVEAGSDSGGDSVAEFTLSEGASKGDTGASLVGDAGDTEVSFSAEDSGESLFSFE